MCHLHSLEAAAYSQLHRTRHRLRGFISCRFVNAVTTDKFARVVDIIEYLKGRAPFGLHLGRSLNVCPLCVFFDAD
jgi:hypothetical protein